MAAISTAILATTAVVGTGLSIAQAKKQREQAKEAQFRAQESAEENALRREAAVATRTENLARERAITEIQRQRDIRLTVNQARQAQAQQIAQGRALGITAGVSSVASDVAGILGAEATAFAAEQQRVAGERQFQDITTGLASLEEVRAIRDQSPATPAARVPQAATLTSQNTFQESARARANRNFQFFFGRGAQGRSQGGRA